MTLEILDWHDGDLLAKPVFDKLNGLVAAGVIGFAAALGEFGAVITFAANIPGETQTLALAKEKPASRNASASPPGTCSAE